MMSSRLFPLVLGVCVRHRVCIRESVCLKSSRLSHAAEEVEGKPLFSLSLSPDSFTQMLYGTDFSFGQPDV